MRWVTNKEQADYMRKRVGQNRNRSMKNKNENDAGTIFLKEDGWKRQAQWGVRIFDFWNHLKGVAVEIDGPEHHQEYDATRDDYNFYRSGIIVLRVANGDLERMRLVAAQVRGYGSWSERRQSMGLAGNSKKSRRILLKQAGLKPAHGNWGPGGR